MECRRPGTRGYSRQSKLCAGDWWAMAGKDAVQQEIIISEPLPREICEQDKWKGILLTQRGCEGCWEHVCWERWEAFRECWRSGWFQGRSASFRFFICSLWQVDGSLYAVEHSGYTWYRSYLSSILPPKGKWKTFSPQEVLLFPASSG